MKQKQLGVHPCPVCGDLIDLDTQHAIEHMSCDNNHREQLARAKDHVRQNQVTLDILHDVVNMAIQV